MIFTDCWAWWCLWLHWYDGEDSVFVRSSSGPPKLGDRGPGTGPTGSQFLSGFWQRWPGGHLQQSYRVFLLPPGKQKWLFTDAASSGWGAQLGSRLTQGLWSASQRSWHINVFGDAGRHQRRERLPASSEVPGGTLDVRQGSDCGLHQEWGGHTILHTHADDVAPAEVVRSQGNNFGSRPSARSPQHPGRFTVHSRPDTAHGVDNGHGASPTSICPVGRTTGRLVCVVRQQTIHQVCIALSGPQGRVHRRHVSTLGQWEGPTVCLSTIQDGRSASRCSDDSDRSSAGNSFLVPGTSGTVPRRAHPAVRQGSAAADSGCHSDRRGDRDSSLPAVKSSRVETLQAILVAKGHSREAAEMMSRSLRESSLHVYESHWVRIVSFCRSKRWHVFKPSFQYLHVAPVQRRITTVDDHFTLHFCVMSLG